MSLRWRLAMAMALVTAVAAGAVTYFAYQTTSNQLLAQVDLNLNDAVIQLQSPVGAKPPSTPGQRPPPPAPGSLFLPGSPLPTSTPAGTPPIAAVQHLDAQGVVDNGNQLLDIPVQAVDRQLAASNGPPVVRDETIRGNEYRVLTSHVRGGAIQVAINLVNVNHSLSKLIWQFSFGALGVAVAAAVVGYLLARRIARPLELLSAAATDVARTGALTLGVQAARQDETGRLTEAIERMLSSLRRSREEQHRLVQDAGHELRTPLTSVCSNVDLLALHDGVLGEEDRRRLVGSAREELRGLVTLVNELVELATDTSSAEESATVEMDVLVRAAAERCASRSGRRIDVEAVPWSLDGRPGALEGAVTNLLENAVKFSPDGTPIEVTVSPGRVAVRDHGPGIAEADLGRIFDRFYRTPSTESRPGSGLGLSIVQKVACEHDGSVFAANAPDGGAVVGFELGAGAPSPAPSASTAPVS